MKRFIELDALRGAAIILMVIFHAAFDLNFLEVLSLDVWSGGWLLMARVVQVIFIGTTGVTLALSYDRVRSQGRTVAVNKRLKHAGVVFGFGLLITLVTWILFKEEAVKFGILHFLGVSMLLALPLLRFGAWNFLLGLLVFLIWIPLQEVGVDFSWGFPLGLAESGFQSLDYFPLVPWFGLFLWGVAWGSWFYKEGKRRCVLSLKIPAFILSSLIYLGKKSLLIYLIHQPILMGLIWSGVYLVNL
jgi:uncharacterized membrane protein